ncbi:hypothetical protein QJS04_geneDACA011267 [Acorus gramineus]|uniref:F-box associated domain-containing protein n=1 Tax=Acorus gramineus TaxID=55184 RepID=A0AAV9ANU4_ACOGR|nr:hypothetical protein QJS04_geneDACA011267 [Acorus gramineus]
MDLCITGLAMSGKVFMNGAVHVLARDNDGSTRLLAYHVKDGRAWTMSLPKVECGEYKREWVGESGGNMRYVISIDSTKTLVFKLCDYAAGGWELKLPIHHLVMHHLSAFHPDREVYYMCCSEMEQWIVVYDPSNNNAEKFGVLLFRQDQQYFPMCWIIQPQPGWVKCFPFSPSMWDPIYDRADGLSRDPDLVLDGIRLLFSDH